MGVVIITLIVIATVFAVVAFIYGLFIVGGFVYGLFAAGPKLGPKLGQVASEHRRLSEALKTITNPDEAQQLIEASTLPPRNKKMMWAVWEHQQSRRG